MQSVDPKTNRVFVPKSVLILGLLLAPASEYACVIIAFDRCALHFSILGKSSAQEGKSVQGTVA